MLFENMLGQKPREAVCNLLELVKRSTGLVIISTRNHSEQKLLA